MRRLTQIETLPDRLRYLRPFQKYLATLSKADIGDSTDTTLLEKIIRKRLRGMQPKEAKKQLRTDLDELENHLSIAHRQDNRLAFIFGFLLIAAEKPKELLKPPAKTKKIVERLTMQLPVGAKSSVDEYSLMVKWKRKSLFILRCNMDDAFGREWILAKLAHPNASEHQLLNILGGGAAPYSQSEAPQKQTQAIRINWGDVTGHKQVNFGDSPIVFKRVDYLLKIPGGYVSVNLQAESLFDESEWETHLATLYFAKPRISKIKSRPR